MENILWYIIIFLGIAVTVLFFLFLALSRKMKKLLKGKNGISLESIIRENNSLLKEREKKEKEYDKKISYLENGLASSVQNISLVRFDALGDVGGGQSFSIAFTDSHKNGVVISSMYTRGGMNIFAKELVLGESQQKLTEEEKSVIQ